VGVARLLPSYAGLLFEKEVRALSRLLSGYERPYAVVLGGAKVSDKIGVIKSLMKRADKLLIGGAMAFTFIKAKGGEVGDSLVEEDKLDLARELMTEAEALEKPLLLPVDVVAAPEISPDAPREVVPADRIPKG